MFTSVYSAAYTLLVFRHTFYTFLFSIFSSHFRNIYYMYSKTKKKKTVEKINLTNFCVGYACKCSALLYFLFISFIFFYFCFSFLLLNFFSAFFYNIFFYYTSNHFFVVKKVSKYSRIDTHEKNELVYLMLKFDVNICAN